jgi:hypothetical protein
VTWEATAPLAASARVPGRLTSDSGEQQLHLVAVDCAYPQPVCTEPDRRSAHQAWQLGEVALLLIDGSTACAVPGTRISPDLAVEVIRRLAKAFGAPAQNFRVTLRL